MEGRNLKESFHLTKEKYQNKQISRWWLVLWVAIFLVLVEVGVQMFYSSSLSRFNTYIDGLNVSNKSQLEIETLLLNSYQSQSVIIENPSGDQVRFSLTELGASVNVSRQATVAMDYSLAMRFVPLSLFWPRNLDVYPDVELGIETSLAQKSPVDASIVAENNQLKVISSQLGLELGNSEGTGSDLCSDKLTLRINRDSILHCNINTLSPNISTDAAKAVADNVKRNLSNGLVFSYNNEQKVRANFSAIISWLDFLPNATDGTIDVVVNIDRVVAFLGTTNLASLNQGAENNKVSLLNGRVTSQTIGKAGWGVNYQAVVDEISDVIHGVASSNIISVELAHVDPSTIYDQTFTDDFNGLTAKLDYLYGDKNVAIVTLDLTGRGRNIYINQWKQFTAASTYKLFVAYSMLKSGNPPDCFDDMIINSDNTCPQTWLDDHGLKNVENEAHEVGASGLTYFGSLDMRTSAMDLANFLSSIYYKILPIDNDRLINDMKAQRFRQGIPSGLGDNAIVADKVGFLWGLLHDAGIVYSNKGDYIQVILTDGYSWDTIADISRQIYDKM